jgi:dihydrofolate synthase / folylpolyglutamate synthase
MTSKKEILDKLFSLQRFGIKPGLERTRDVLAERDNPHHDFPCIHVAGTNGKGTVCSIIASVLQESGHKVGLYTSPHLVDFNERIRINGEMISDEDLINLAESYLPFSEKYGATFFEITTAMAFEYFAKQKVDIAVLETGLGGRFDSTNVVIPLVSVITRIDYDHSEYLGDTIEEIATEKAGIIKQGVPVVLSENSPEVVEVITSVAKKKNSGLIIPCSEYETDNYAVQANISDASNKILHSAFPGSVQNDNPDIGTPVSSNVIPAKLLGAEAGIQENVGNTNKTGQGTDNNAAQPNISDAMSIKETPLPILGLHQQENLTTSLAALDMIKEKYNISEKSIEKGFNNISQNTGICSRIELIRNEPELILDVSHNESAIKSLVSTMQEEFPEIGKWNIVFAAMHDKNISSILNILQPICYKLILPQLKIDRAESNISLESIAKENGYDNIVKYDSVEDLVESNMVDENATLVTGSFYLAGEILPIIKKSLNRKK